MSGFLLLAVSVAPALNQPPTVPCFGIYRTYTGYPISLAIGATDPDGGVLDYTSTSLPQGGQLDEFSGVFSWTPGATQLGPFYAPFAVTDAGVPPLETDGFLTFAVAPPDPCVVPTCVPASGCTGTVMPLIQSCCSGGPAARVAEPHAGCPQGRVIFAGRNTNSGFGRLQDCDQLAMLNSGQSGASVRFNLQTRCLTISPAVTVHARLDTTSQIHPLLFDATRPVLLTNVGEFAQALALSFPVLGSGPFFDLEGADGTLSVDVTDSAQASASQKLRVKLTFNALTDLPDLDSSGPPAPAMTCSVPTPSPSQTGTATITRTVTATGTITNTRTPSATPTTTPTATVSRTSTPSRTPTVSPTRTPSRTPTWTLTLTPTLTATVSRTPSLTETPTPTPTRSLTATATPGTAIDFGTLSAQPGSTGCVAARLSSGGQVASTQNDIDFDASSFTLIGCSINPASGIGSSANKQLVESVLGVGLERVTISGSNLSPMPDGLLYTCTLAVGVGVAEGTHAVSNAPSATDTQGNDIVAVTGRVGQIVVTTCTGDCNGDATVSIGEVIKCINLFLGQPLCNPTNPDLSCPNADADGSGSVSIGEVVKCVNSFLAAGCA